MQEIQSELSQCPCQRNTELEEVLQSTLDSGNSVWVVGDIHGHADELDCLISALELSERDHLVCVGDLIDRGPNSRGVVSRFREHPRFHSILGNHEYLAIQCIHENGQVILDYDWLLNGGGGTLRSYGIEDIECRQSLETHPSLSTLSDDLHWMRTLPLECVLNDWRIVHAGYHPFLPIDKQGVRTICWVRDVFLNHKTPIDPLRCVVHGHTPTLLIDGSGEGEPALSQQQLKDGRPVRIGLDTSLSAWSPGVLCAFDLASNRLVFANAGGRIESHLDDFMPRPFGWSQLVRSKLRP